MDKIFRKIRVLLLFFAVLAINGHLMIPHDHHLMDSVSQDKTCPLTNNKTSHHSGFPIHCHAFNDLASEKAISLNVIRDVHYIYFINTGIFNITAINLSEAGIRIVDFPSLLFKSDTPDSSPLRAPPLLG